MHKSEDAPEEPLSQVAWQSLREDIIAGKLAPGSRLRMIKLRERYGIGATPLREALSRLVADGFVVSLERRGFMVAPMSLNDFRHLTDLRKLLEKEALRLSLQHGDDVWESRVIATFHQLGKAQAQLQAKDEASVTRWEQLNEAFHETLVSACPSQWVLQFRNTIYAYTKRYRLVCLSTRTVSRDVQAEHTKLRDAAIEHNVKRISELIDEHIETTYRKVAASGKLSDTSPVR
jgi:GntR family carbon starvation induced transcriptional regulator